jgi:hypothetical protein
VCVSLLCVSMWPVCVWCYVEVSVSNSFNFVMSNACVRCLDL